MLCSIRNPLSLVELSVQDKEIWLEEVAEELRLPGATGFVDIAVKVMLATFE